MPPLTNLPKTTPPQAAHPIHTPPRGAGNPVLPLVGKGSHGAEFGFIGTPWTSTQHGCSGWSVVWRGVRLAVPGTETYHHAGRTLPCHQRNWQRAQPWGRGTTELLALWPVPVPTVGWIYRHGDGYTGSNDDKKQPHHPCSSQLPLIHLLCLFQELPYSPGHHHLPVAGTAPA